MCTGLCFLKLDAKLSTRKLTKNDSDSDDGAEAVLATPRGGGKSETYLYSKEIERDANKALELVRLCMTMEAFIATIFNQNWITFLIAIIYEVTIISCACKPRVIFHRTSTTQRQTIYVASSPRFARSRRKCPVGHMPTHHRLVRAEDGQRGCYCALYGNSSGRLKAAGVCLVGRYFGSVSWPDSCPMVEST